MKNLYAVGCLFERIDSRSIKYRSCLAVVDASNENEAIGCCKKLFEQEMSENERFSQIGEPLIEISVDNMIEVLESQGYTVTKDE